MSGKSMRISAEEVMKILAKELNKVDICLPMKCYDFSKVSSQNKLKTFRSWAQASGFLDDDNEWNCDSCGDYNRLDEKFWAIDMLNISKEAMSQIDAIPAVCDRCIEGYKLKKQRMDKEEFIDRLIAKIVKENAKLNKKIETKANPYLKFLPDNWAEAIVLNPENAESIISLWKSDWWKQYDEDDTLIQAILNGSLKENIAVELNRIRSDHPEAVQMCIDGKIDSQWLLDLMNAGFLGRDDAVLAVLNGADPMIISKLDEGGDYDSEKMPPGL